jgi:YVTN family beta-propeller protein
MNRMLAQSVVCALWRSVAALVIDRSISELEVGQAPKSNLKFPTVGLFATALLLTNANTISVEAAESVPVLSLIASIDLPGPSGKRFDYLVIDYDNGLLFSTHLAANQTYVIDLKSNDVLQTISDTPGAEGIEYVPDEGKIYTSNAGDDTVGVIDLKTMRVIRKIPTERKPDGSTYAAIAHKLYVSDERAKAVAVIDVRTDEILTTLHLDSETGVPIYDVNSKLVYVNWQDRSELAAIDPRTDQVVARYPVEGCKRNHGMALDVENHRAFLACEGNDKLVMFDLDAHKAIDSLPMPSGADVVQFDPGIKRIYVACANGYISVFQEDGLDQLRKLSDVPVQPRVHSLAVDARTHRVYAPEQEEAGQGVARMLVFEAALPKP